MDRSGLSAAPWIGVAVMLAVSSARAAESSPGPAAGGTGDGVSAGFAERDITPAIGMEQPGGYGKAFHRALHDPCKARASVWSHGGTRVAIVGVDALLVRRETVERIRARATAACGIPESQILVAASHSHSSGPTGMVLPGEFDDCPEDVRMLAYEQSSCADPAYLALFEERVVDAIVAADRRRANLAVSVGSGVEDAVAFNRRFRMRSGLTMTHPGQGNPDIVEPAGPIDPEVGVVGAWTTDRRLVGCIVTFACHATTSPGGISANYICYLERAVRGFFGPDVVVVFLPGCCGDITQVDNRSPLAHPKPEQWAKLVGGRVGAEAVKVLLAAEPGQVAPIAVETTVLDLGRRVPRPERVAACREIVARTREASDPTEWTFAKEIVLLDAITRRRPREPVEVQAVQIGPAVFVTNPAEFFVDYGLRIKKGSPFPFTFPVELANGCVGYVPTEEALGPAGGGYETRLTSYSSLEPSAGTRIMEAGIELSRRLTPGAVPSRPPAPPWRGSGWGYGTVRPELN
jgi:neutral ceramidase